MLELYTMPSSQLLEILNHYLLVGVIMYLLLPATRSALHYFLNYMFNKWMFPQEKE